MRIVVSNSTARRCYRMVVIDKGVTTHHIPYSQIAEFLGQYPGAGVEYDLFPKRENREEAA